MTTFVLVHSPLMGPATWSGVARLLEELGHARVVPSLLDATAAGPPFASAQAAAVVDAVWDAGVGDALVLVGHSGAGPLLPAAGAELDDDVAAYLFVDAGLPTPGRPRVQTLHPSFHGRLLGMARDGVLPPWSEWWGDEGGRRPDPRRRRAPAGAGRAAAGAHGPLHRAPPRGADLAGPSL